MTDLVARNANFSGGRLIGYTPPVDSIEYFGWFGGSVEDSLRNFGSGGLSEVVGAISNIGDYFVDLGPSGHIKTAIAPQGNERTYFAVAAQLMPGESNKERPVFISSEDTNPIGGRKGSTLYVQAGTTNGNSVRLVRYYGRGTSGSEGPYTGTLDNDPLKFQCYAATVTKLADGGLNLTVHNLSTGTKVSDAVSADDVVSYDESRFLIGSTYRQDGSAYVGKARVACAGVAQRALSEPDLNRLYESVKRRMASFGVVI